jgi:hypothetical protein
MVDWNCGVMASFLLGLYQNLVSLNLGGFISQWSITHIGVPTLIYVRSVLRVSDLSNLCTRVLRRWRFD